VAGLEAPGRDEDIDGDEPGRPPRAHLDRQTRL
jgi:hypothetical protein